MGLSSGAINHAISFGANYSHGLMFKRTPDSYEEKNRFRLLKSPKRRSLQSNLCVSVVCADTESKAHKLFKQYRAEIVDEGPTIIGSPEQIRLEFLKSQLDYQIDEIVVRMLIVDPIERLNSYRLLSEVCGLKRGRDPLKTAA
jgi:alkanesulfonate monooxygenase SsuD/methylene tetrahydromethanopterin reductase-like flavin-dependent oxidoreductase (luciferase family)